MSAPWQIPVPTPFGQKSTATILTPAPMVYTRKEKQSCVVCVRFVLFSRLFFVFFFPFVSHGVQLPLVLMLLLQLLPLVDHLWVSET
jgi:hypothetical protein